MSAHPRTSLVMVPLVVFGYLACSDSGPSAPAPVEGVPATTTAPSTGAPSTRGSGNIRLLAIEPPAGTPLSLASPTTVRVTAEFGLSQPGRAFVSLASSRWCVFQFAEVPAGLARRTVNIDLSEWDENRCSTPIEVSVGISATDGDLNQLGWMSTDPIYTINP